MHDFSNPLRPIGDETLTFNGINQSRTIPNDDAFNFAREQDFTIAARILSDRPQPCTARADNDIIEKWDWQGGPYPFVIRLGKSGKIQGCRFNGSVGAGLESPTSLNDGVFHHIVFTRRNEAGKGMLYLYVDGKQVASSPDLISGHTRGHSALYLGKRGGGSHWFAGSIKDLSIYDVALDDNQIARIAAVNRAPVANLGAGREILVGEQLRMNKGAGSDPDGNPLTYAWELQAPAGSKAALDDASSPTPAFTPDLPGDYTLSLVVNDGLTHSLPGTATWTAKPRPNRAPVAHIANGHAELTVGEIVAIDGSGTDPDGDALTYMWSLIEKPAGSHASLANADSAHASFTPDLPGGYVISLSTFDGQKLSAPVSARYVAAVPNQAPSVRADAKGSRIVGDPVQLTCEATDPEGKPLTYTWELTRKPQDSEASLDDPSAATPSYTPDIPGTYAAEVTVSDGELSSSARVVWDAQPMPAPAPHEPKYNWSDNVLAQTLSKYGLGKGDAERVLARGKELDNGNRYLRREELEAAAKDLVEQTKRGTGSYRFSDHVLAQVLAKHDLSDAPALLHEAAKHDEDHNRYLRREELESAAAALTARTRSLTGRRWSDNVLADVLAKYGVDRDALLQATVRQREHDRYFSREELEAAAKTISEGDVKAQAASDAQTATPQHEGAWAKVEAFLGPFAFMIHGGSSPEKIQTWEGEQGVTLSAQVRELMEQASCVELPTFDINRSNYAAEAMLVPLSEWVRADRSEGLAESSWIPEGIGEPQLKLRDLVEIGTDPAGVDDGVFVVLNPATDMVYGVELTTSETEPLGTFSEWIANRRVELESGAAYAAAYHEFWLEVAGEKGNAETLAQEYTDRVYSKPRKQRWEAVFPEFKRVFDAM